ncbi:MAG: rhomboid family intramembrane serine protease [Patulibacter sp.]
MSTSTLEPSRSRDVAQRDPRTNGLMLVAAMVALMWIVEVIDAIADQRLDQFGIIPRQVSGLDGIVFSPFLHSGFGHLISNTVPFLILGAVIALNGAIRVLQVTVIVGLVAGIGVWLFAASNTLTVGASGIVMGYATYLIARGVFSRRAFELLIGVVIAVVWGGMVLSSLLPEDGVSWQAHLFGGIGGVIAAWLLTADRPAADAASSR